MGRFEPTGPVENRDLEHSVVELSWGALRGAFGASDGRHGAHGNVPSALSVLRHATLYATIPDEIDDAFGVLEKHVMRGPRLYPVAVHVLPFLFDVVRRGSPLSPRI